MDQPLSSTPTEVSVETLSGVPAEGRNGGKIEMLFRFWGASGRGAETGEGGSINAPGNASGHHPGVLALIEDAVASKRGAFVSSAEYLYISRLKRPSDALAVSRQVQLGLEGFRARHGSGPVAVSIAIDAGGERSGGVDAMERASGQEPPHDLVTLLKLSKPAQILLTHDLCQQVTSIKGLPLRSFPARFGVYEYLWTTEEKLELLESEPQLTLAALPMAQPAKEKNGAATSTAATAPGAPAGTTKAFTAPPVSAKAEEPEEAKPGLPRWVLFAGAGVAAAIAVAALGIHLAQKPAASSAPPQTPAVQVPASAAPAPVVQPSAPAPAQAVQKTHAALLKPPAAKPVATAAPAPEVKPPAAPAADCTLGGDTSRYVGLGEQARGRGDYANAIRIFREVLACDANNAAAREGLDKSLQAQQQPDQ
jgi:hypothetical protein